MQEDLKCIRAFRHRNVNSSSLCNFCFCCTLYTTTFHCNLVSDLYRAKVAEENQAALEVGSQLIMHNADKTIFKTRAWLYAINFMSVAGVE